MPASPGHRTGNHHGRTHARSAVPGHLPHRKGIHYDLLHRQADEYQVDGVLYLVFHVAGHGWFPARPGNIDSINDDGTIVEKDGRERRIRWCAGPEGS